MLFQLIKQFNKNSQIYLRIKVRPASAVTIVKQIIKDRDGELIKIDIAAPAVRGRANQELIKFLANEFAIQKNNVKIISGAGERIKLIKLTK